MGEAVAATLLLVAALLCATAPVAAVRRRVFLQVVLIAATTLAAVLAGLGPVQTGFLGGMLVLIALAATTFASDLRQRTEDDRAAREAAERRVELLKIVRALPELEFKEAAQVTSEALRSLGFDGAGVALARSGRLVPVALEGIPPLDRLTRLEDGLAGRAVLEGRTVSLADYRRSPARLAGRDEIRAVIAAPVYEQGQPSGVVMGVRHTAGEPPEADIEILEVMAAHLGAVLSTHQQLHNQRTLLARMDRLDAMRTAFAQEVSDELRDPLTLITGVGHTVLTHGDDLPAEDRQLLLDRMCTKAEELQGIIDALLDFSRFHSERRAPMVQRVTLGELFGPLSARVRFDDAVTVDIEVEVDVALARHAAELLLGERRGRIIVTADEHEVVLVFHLDTQDREGLLQSLVAQTVLEAGGGARFDGRPRLAFPRADRPVGVQV